MANDHAGQHDDHKPAELAAPTPAAPVPGLGGLPLPALLGDPRLDGRGNARVKASVLLQMQRQCVGGHDQGSGDILAPGSQVAAHKRGG